MEVMDLLGDEVDGFFFDYQPPGRVRLPLLSGGDGARGSTPAGPSTGSATPTGAGSVHGALGSACWRARRTSRVSQPGHIAAGLRPVLDTYTHLEIESLPSTGEWGYNHYPITVRYAHALGKPHLGMTGKFHTAWGDFGSFKNQAALEFECFQMLAAGAACSIGDQLHPRGRLNEPAYTLIGKVYASVEAKEPWCVGAVPKADVAVFNVEAVGKEDGRVDSSHSGALRMLLEGHHQFAFVDGLADWTAYRVLVLPDKVPLDEALAEKVRDYLARGGKVIARTARG